MESHRKLQKKSLFDLGKSFVKDDVLFNEIAHFLKTTMFEANSTNPLIYMPYLVYLFPVQYNVLKCATARINKFLENEVQEHVETYHEDLPRDFIDVYLREIITKETSKEQTISFKSKFKFKSNLIVDF